MSVSIHLPSVVLVIVVTLAVACGRKPPEPTHASATDSPLISMSEPSLAALITPQPDLPPTETPVVVQPSSLQTEPLTATSTPAPVPTPTPIPTATLTSLPPTDTPTSAPNATPTETSVPTRTPEPSATPIPTAISDRPELYKRIPMPRGMVFANWHWQPWDAITHPSIEIPFEIHNDPGNFSDTHGLYLILAISEISDTPFYFGIQTHVSGRSNENTGKGVIFSRWDERDLSNARVPPGGFTQSSGHEGDFIGVRRNYEWTTGKYTARIAFETADIAGEWYGLWITDESSDVETWIGSLRFPKPKIGRGRGLHSGVINALEIYGHKPMRPIDIPYWHVSIEPPVSATASLPYWFVVYYGDDEINNNDAWWDSEAGHVHFIVGGETEREHEEQEVWLDE